MRDSRPPAAGTDARSRDILGRPENEKAYVLLPVGFPAQGCRVPDITKKPLDEIREVV